MTDFDLLQQHNSEIPANDKGGRRARRLLRSRGSVRKPRRDSREERMGVKA